MQLSSKNTSQILCSPNFSGQACDEYKGFNQSALTRQFMGKLRKLESIFEHTSSFSEEMSGPFRNGTIHFKGIKQTMPTSLVDSESIFKRAQIVYQKDVKVIRSGFIASLLKRRELESQLQKWEIRYNMLKKECCDLQRGPQIMKTTYHNYFSSRRHDIFYSRKRCAKKIGSEIVLLRDMNQSYANMSHRKTSVPTVLFCFLTVSLFFNVLLVLI
jgi:hypothetical protein